MFVWPKSKEKCTSTEPSTKQYVDIPLELGIKKLRPKDVNKIKDKRIKWAKYWLLKETMEHVRVPLFSYSYVLKYRQQTKQKYFLVRHI